MASKWKWMCVTELELVFTFVGFARAYSIANKWLCQLNVLIVGVAPRGGTSSKTYTLIRYLDLGVPTHSGSDPVLLFCFALAESCPLPPPSSFSPHSVPSPSPLSSPSTRITSSHPHLNHYSTPPHVQQAAPHHLCPHPMLDHDDLCKYLVPQFLL